MSQKSEIRTTLTLTRLKYLLLGTRLMKLLEIGTKKIPNHQEEYLGLTVEWFLRRENKPWLTNIIQKIRSLDGR